jgi:hypothetical protein
MSDARCSGGPGRRGQRRRVYELPIQAPPKAYTRGDPVRVASIVDRGRADSCALSKADQIRVAIARPEGASLLELMLLTGWHAHSIRGFISAALRKKRGLCIVSCATLGHRRYRHMDRHSTERLG